MEYSSYTGQYYDYKNTKILEQAKRIAELEQEVEKLKKKVDPPLWKGEVRAAKITGIENIDDDSVRIKLEECKPEKCHKDWFEANEVGPGDYLIASDDYLYFMEKEVFESSFTKVEE